MDHSNCWQRMQMFSPSRKHFEEILGRMTELVKVKSIPIVHDALPTLFITSCGLQHTNRFIKGETLPYPEWLIQECVRFPDRYDLKSESHLCAFQMAGVFVTSRTGIEPVIPILNELLKSFHIARDRIYATISGACQIGNQKLEKDLRGAENILKIGLDSNNIYVSEGDENVWMVRGSKRTGGRTVELFFDKTRKNCSKECTPGCSCGRFIEIANIVQTEVIEGKIRKEVLLQMALGVERFNAVGKEVNVPELEDLRVPGNRLVQKYGITLSNASIAIDRARAILLAVRDGERPKGRGRGNILRKLIREFENALSLRHNFKNDIDRDWVKFVLSVVSEDLGNKKDLELLSEIVLDELGRI